MNLILAFIQFILIFLIVMIEYRNGSVVIILWATLLVMFGIPHFVAVLTETFIYPQYVYIYASIVSSLVRNFPSEPHQIKLLYAW